MFKKIKRAIKKFVQKQNNQKLKDSLDRLLLYKKRISFEKYCWLYDIDDKLIVFEAFKGKSFSGSPKAIYEHMLQDSAYQDFRFIWIFKSLEKHSSYFKDEERVTITTNYSREYWQAYASAKYWVNNAGIGEHLSPRQGQVYIETWHGTPFEKIYADSPLDDFLQSSKAMNRQYSDLSRNLTYNKDATAEFVKQCIPVNECKILTFNQHMRNHKVLKFVYFPCRKIKCGLRKIYFSCSFKYRKLKRSTKKATRYIYYNITGFFKYHGICISENSKNLYAYKNNYKGKRCFIIGNGPSLSVKDLELLRDEYTFGCNMLYKLYDETLWRPSFYCITDNFYASLANDEFVSNVHEPAFTIRPAYKKMKQKPEQLLYVNHIFSDKHFKMRGNVMAYSMTKGTVLSLMIDLAAFMGFEEMYLIGVDCTNPHAANGHFTQNYSSENIVNMDLRRISRMLNNDKSIESAGQHIVERAISVYQKIKEYMDRKGKFKIYNATRGGALEVFERRNLDDVLKQ